MQFVAFVPGRNREGNEIFLTDLAMGADGAIGSTYNFMAEKFIRIKNLFLKGNYDEAKKLQTQANEIIKVLTDVGVFQGANLP